MANDPKVLNLDALLEICRVTREVAEKTADFIEEISAAAAIATRFKSQHDHTLANVTTLITSALARLQQYNPTHLPFGYSGPKITSEKWVERDDVERVAKQIVGMTHPTMDAEYISFAVIASVDEAVTLGFVEQQRFDGWRPGMESGSGWRHALRSLQYGVTRARATIPAPPSSNELRPSPVIPPNGSHSYIYWSSEKVSSLDQSSVIYRCKTAYALPLLRLCNRQFAEEAGKQFFAKPETEVPADDLILLDEALDQMSICDDPDPGVYDPPFDRKTIERAQIARAIEGWEGQLESRQKSAAPAEPFKQPVKRSFKSVEEALQHLLHVVERHRLLFLFCAIPKRRKPAGDSYTWDTLERDELLDEEKILTDQPDADGEFLFRHRLAIERYAQTCIGQFGPGKGWRAGEWVNGKYVETPGASLPRWSLDDFDCAELERSSETMIAACKDLLRLPGAKKYLPLVREVRSRTHDIHQSRWYSSILVTWEYLPRLDEVIASIRTAEIDFVDADDSEEVEPDEYGDADSSESHSDEQANTENAAEMTADELRVAGLGVLMLLAQAYYKMLEQAISAASWCGQVDLELNHSYLWVTDQISNLLKNHPALQGFPGPFKPMFPDLYPSTIQDCDWEDMIAPEAENFLSSVQRFLLENRYVDPEPQSKPWIFIQLFRPSVESAINRAIAYADRMRKEMKRMLSNSRPKQPDSPAQSDANSVAPKEENNPDVKDSEPLPFSVSVDSLSVSMGKSTHKFSGRSAKLFLLLQRISRRPGQHVYFDDLRSVGDVWDGENVEDSSIRGAVSRLRDELRPKFPSIAGAIRTGTLSNRQYVTLDADKLARKSN